MKGIRIFKVSALIAVLALSKIARAQTDEAEGGSLGSGPVAFDLACTDHRPVYLMVYSSARGDPEGVRRVIDILDPERKLCGIFVLQPDQITRVTKVLFGSHKGMSPVGDVAFKIELQGGDTIYATNWPEELSHRQPDETICVIPDSSGGNPVTVEASSSLCRPLIARTDQ